LEGDADVAANGPEDDDDDVAWISGEISSWQSYMVRRLGALGNGS
jgi:hypothetical protein